jgi:DHA2 family multidrug resistance protein
MNNAVQQTLPTGFERAIIVITAITAAMLQLIDSSIVNVSLREISGSIGATTTEIAWTVTAFAISNVVIIPLTGLLSDLFGRKLYFTGSIVIFTLASFACGASGSLWTLVFWRFVQGLGGGALLTIAQTVIVEAFPPEKINVANSIFGMGVILGPTFGPTLGGYITDNYSWHWIFYINVPIGIVATLLSWRYIPDRNGAQKPTKIDWLGIMLLVVGVSTLQFVLEEGSNDDWFESKMILSLTILSVVSIIGFIWHELTTDQPAVNLRLLGRWNMAVGSLLNTIVGMLLFATVFVFPLFAQIGLGWTASQTGNFMIPGALASAVAMAICGRILSKGVNPKSIMLIGAMLVFGFAMIMSFSSPDSTEKDFFLPFIMRGFGTGFLMAPVLGLVMQGLKPSEIPQAAGLSNMFRQLGGAVGIAVMNIYLIHCNAVNDNNLIQHTSIYNGNFADRLAMMVANFRNAGYDQNTAEGMAQKVFDGLLFKQQSLVSYDTIFWNVGIAVIFCIPLILLIKRDKNAKGIKVEMSHE